MIGYVTLGTNNLENAIPFYDELMKVYEAGRISEHPRGMIWGLSMDQPMLIVLSPYDGEKSSAGNGTMVALAAQSQEQVDELHSKALELGAENEGDPGKRNDMFYGGYFRDLDGNKLAVFCPPNS